MYINTVHLENIFFPGYFVAKLLPAGYIKTPSVRVCRKSSMQIHNICYELLNET